LNARGSFFNLVAFIQWFGRRAVIDNAHYVLPGLSGALLNETNQFILFAFHELQVIVVELRKFPLQPGLGKGPSSLDFKNVHKSSWLISLFRFPHCRVTNISSAYGVPAGVKGRDPFQTKGFILPDCRNVLQMATGRQATACKLHHFKRRRLHALPVNVHLPWKIADQMQRHDSSLKKRVVLRIGRKQKRKTIMKRNTVTHPESEQRLEDAKSLLSATTM
jgi:hypothetical protein